VPIEIEWMSYPDNRPNSHFPAATEATGRSRSAADVHLPQRRAFAPCGRAGQQAAQRDCYNVLEGFEGDKDASGQRGRVGGWRHAGLPWHS
jgi:hypothetical protein